MVNKKLAFLKKILNQRDFPLKSVCLLLSLFEERKKGNKGCQKVHPSHGNSTRTDRFLETTYQSCT